MGELSHLRFAVKYSGKIAERQEGGSDTGVSSALVGSGSSRRGCSHHALRSGMEEGSSAPSRIHEGELGAAEGPTVDQTIERMEEHLAGTQGSSEAQVENRAPGGKNQLVDPSLLLPARTTHLTCFHRIYVNTGTLHFTQGFQSQLA